MAVEIDAIQSAKSIGWTDALLSRLAANSVGLGGRLSITAPANASALSSTGYSLTGSDATSMIDLAGTWDTTGTPTLIKANVTNTASNAASLLMDLQVGGVSKFAVDRASTICSNGGNSKIHFPFNGTFSFSGAGASNTSHVYFDSAGISIRSNGYFAFTNSATNATTTLDTILRRDAANTLALRNAANAQTFNVYGTWTSISVYERAFMRYSVANTRFEIGTEHLGATARSLSLMTDGTARLTIDNTQFTVGSVTSVYLDATTFFASTTASGSRSSAGNGFKVGSAYDYSFSSTTGANGTADVGFKRTIAGVVGVTDGSTGGGAIGMQEQTAPAAPAANGVYIYAEDNGSGKTRLMALFASGAAQQIAIEP